MEKLKQIIKLALPLAIGGLIVFLFYQQLDAQAIAEFKKYFTEANYWWVGIAVGVTFISHISRILRWQMMIKSLGYTISFSKSFYSIFINYLVNMGIPRTGEIARCAVLKQYDNIPIDKSLGLLINERIIDVLMLGITGLAVVALQFNIFISFSKIYILPFMKEKGLLENVGFIFVLSSIAILFLLLSAYLIKKGKFPLQNKFKSLFSGIKEGILSIKKLENPLGFVAHSIFIWLMYWLMTYFIFFAIPSSASVTPLMALSVLFFGTFAFIVVSGGLGAYPVTLGVVLSLYGLDPLVGNAAGWLLWGGQTLMILVLGAFSFLMLSFQKGKVKPTI